ncbi:glycosyltransferase family 4 protein [Haloarcula sp. GH36]|uniref:glycosyltransferase family 4 protein n=1 Tax=Haloarcula montana TaxID=3111776 RepID=UPI002D76736D|nr:glycosyltransferase family 4 protein [Haloarcula sp. GH36]
MKILQTPVQFYPHIGGVETYVYNYGRELVAKGHDVTVLCAKVDRDQPDEEYINGIRVKRLRPIGKIAGTKITPGLIPALQRELTETDVLHTHLPTPWSADLSAVAGRLADVPTILTYHNDITSTGHLSYVADAYNATALRATLHMADRIVVTRNSYVKHSNYLDTYVGKTTTIQPGVDLDRFTPSCGENFESELDGYGPEVETLFFLGVLSDKHRYKGVDILLEAFEHAVSRTNRDLRLVVGGGGELRSEYETVAAERGIGDIVEFPGRIPGDKLGAMYANADAFVLPSTSPKQEGFGLVLLEALACETPVVTTDIVGVAPDIEREPIGSVVRPGDPAALAKGITNVIEETVEVDRGRTRELCHEKYSWATNTESLLDLYRAVLK